MTVNRSICGTASEFLARALRGPTRRLSHLHDGTLPFTLYTTDIAKITG
jgi:hypothetical protein